MVSAETDEDLAVARAEVRQLREMIDVLRGELEESEARLVAERRRAAARQELDRDHGRQGVDALRVQLEAAVIERNAAVPTRSESISAHRPHWPSRPTRSRS